MIFVTELSFLKAGVRGTLPCLLREFFDSREAVGSDVA